MDVRIGLLILAVGIFFDPAMSQAQYCPDPEGGSADLPPTLRQGVVTYRTGLQVDIDGAPNAYSVDGALGSLASGGALDHICSGVDILEAVGGTLKDKYPPNALKGQGSVNCLADYRRLRDAGFPACSTGECVKFVGISGKKDGGRPCAIQFNPKDNKGACGQPAIQTGADGKPSAFYVSATSYHRMGFVDDDQSSYPDARYVPYLVYDGARLKNFGVVVGDLALVAWKGRATFAVYGDSGNHLCEASVATHNRLLGKPDSDWVNWRHYDVASGALVAAFPGSGKKYMAAYPEHRDGAAPPGQLIYEAGMKALSAVGEESILKLVGLTSVDAIAKE